VLRIGACADLALWRVARLEQLVTQIAMHRPQDIIIRGQSVRLDRGN
jgi:hypothetical protein